MLLDLTYSQGLLGLKIMYLIYGNHKKSLLHRTVLVCHNLYCSFAIYAVLMHSMLLDCNMCCFIAVHATLIPFCCNLRCFVAAIWLLQNTRFPRHFWGGSQALSTFNDVCLPSWGALLAGLASGVSYCLVQVIFSLCHLDDPVHGAATQLSGAAVGVLTAGLANLRGPTEQFDK